MLRQTVLTVTTVFSDIDIKFKVKVKMKVKVASVFEHE
jgi:hypothetical protein